MGVSRATRESIAFWATQGEAWRRRFHTDKKQFQVKQQMAEIPMRS